MVKQKSNGEVTYPQNIEAERALLGYGTGRDASLDFFVTAFTKANKVPRKMREFPDEPIPPSYYVMDTDGFPSVVARSGSANPATISVPLKCEFPCFIPPSGVSPWSTFPSRVIGTNSIFFHPVPMTPQRTKQQAVRFNSGFISGEDFPAELAGYNTLWEFSSEQMGKEFSNSNTDCSRTPSQKAGKMVPWHEAIIAAKNRVLLLGPANISGSPLGGTVVTTEAVPGPVVPIHEVSFAPFTNSRLVPFMSSTVHVHII